MNVWKRANPVTARDVAGILSAERLDRYGVLMTDNGDSYTDTKICPADENHFGHDHPENHSPGVHHHVDVTRGSGKRLLFTLCLNFAIPVAQVIGGLYANSVALIGDATHNFSDFTAILISYIAYRIGRKGATPRATFGYKRAEVLAALVNVVLLLGAVVFILYEAYERFRKPEPIAGSIVMWLAGVGIVGNGFSALLLHKDSKHSLNIRGAFLHMLGDLLTSVVVFINGLVLLFKPWYWLDPLLSLLIVVFIVKNCWSILKEASNVLMDATPTGLNIEEVMRFLEGVPGVRGVHYLHAWNVSSDSVAFSCHIEVEDQMLSQTEVLAEKIRQGLFQRFGIDHPILQFETSQCGNGGLLCEISCPGSPKKANSGNKPRSEKKNKKLSHELFLRLFLGLIFVYAGIGKVLHPAAFAEAVSNYQILPQSLVNFVAIVLPWVELLVGSCLVLGIFLPGAVFLANLLLLSFFVALVAAFARGLNIECGCFNTSVHKLAAGSMGWYLVRDIIFLIIGVYIFFRTCLRIQGT